MVDGGEENVEGEAEEAAGAEGGPVADVGAVGPSEPEQRDREEGRGEQAGSKPKFGGRALVGSCPFGGDGVDAHHEW